MSHGDAKYKKYHKVNLLATVKLDTRRRSRKKMRELFRSGDRAIGRLNVSR